jgi:hypothetical protein
MSVKDYAQIIIHKIENGWRLEYRELGSVNPSTDYQTDAALIDAVSSLVNAKYPE